MNNHLLDEEKKDPATRFFRFYEAYEKAKANDPGEIARFALQALSDIHKISGVSAAEDRNANVRVMHRLLGPILNEAAIREMYDQLRKDAGIE